MSFWQVHALGLVVLVIAATLYYASVDTVQMLSPQGCRMSWMSPSYVLQAGFDRSWSPLADRYSLWLYREVGWEGNEVCRVFCASHG
jgi:GPI inositol-deacylase